MVVVVAVVVVVVVVVAVVVVVVIVVVIVVVVIVVVAVVVVVVVDVFGAQQATSKDSSVQKVDWQPPGPDILPGIKPQGQVKVRVSQSDTPCSHADKLPAVL